MWAQGFLGAHLECLNGIGHLSLAMSEIEVS